MANLITSGTSRAANTLGPSNPLRKLPPPPHIPPKNNHIPLNNSLSERSSGHLVGLRERYTRDKLELLFPSMIAGKYLVKNVPSTQNFSYENCSYGFFLFLLWLFVRYFLIFLCRPKTFPTLPYGKNIILEYSITVHILFYKN